MSTCGPSNIIANWGLPSFPHKPWPHIEGRVMESAFFRSSNRRTQRPCFDQGRPKVTQTFSLHEDPSFPRPLSRASLTREFRFSRITRHIKPGFSRLYSVVKGMLGCMFGDLRQLAVVFGLPPPPACEYCETARCTEMDFRTTHSPW